MLTAPTLDYYVLLIDPLPFSSGAAREEQHASMEHSGEEPADLPPLRGEGELQHYHYHRRASAGGGVVHVAAVKPDEGSQLPTQAAQPAAQQVAHQTAHACNPSGSFSSRRPGLAMPGYAHVQHGCPQFASMPGPPQLFGASGPAPNPAIASTQPPLGATHFQSVNASDA